MWIRGVIRSGLSGGGGRGALVPARCHPHFGRNPGIFFFSLPSSTIINVAPELLVQFHCLAQTVVERFERPKWFMDGGLKSSNNCPSNKTKRRDRRRASRDNLVRRFTSKTRASDGDKINNGSNRQRRIRNFIRTRTVKQSEKKKGLISSVRDHLALWAWAWAWARGGSGPFALPRLLLARSPRSPCTSHWTHHCKHNEGAQCVSHGVHVSNSRAFNIVGRK